MKRFSTAVSPLLVIALCHGAWAGPSVTATENKEKLLKTRSCRGCDLTNLNFNRADLKGVDLEGADLSFSTFFLATLAEANLKKSTLQGTVLGGTDLGDADLRGADTRGARLDSAYLGGTKIEGEFVSGQVGEEADLVKEVFVADQGQPKLRPEKPGVKIGDRRDFEPSPPVVPTETIQAAPVITKTVAVDKPVLKKETASVTAPPNLTPEAPVAKKITPMRPATIQKVAVAENKVVTSSERSSKEVEKKSAVAMDSPAMDTTSTPAAEMTGITALALNKAKRDNLSKLLDKNRCFECDLSGMDLSGQDLEGADLEKADLSGCNLSKADLREANLKGAVLKGADLSKADLRKADFYRADLSDANLNEAKQKGTLFDNAVMDGATGVLFSPFLKE